MGPPLHCIVLIAWVAFARAHACALFATCHVEGSRSAPPYPAALRAHPGHFRGSWRRAASPSDLPRHPNFYVHVPSLTDASAAPPGHHSCMVLLPVANMQEAAQRSTAGGAGGGASYEALVSAGRTRVLQALSEAGAGDLGAPGVIASETVTAPPEWAARYGLAHGAAFGLAHGLGQLSLLRPGQEDVALPGLYFVGASARPGNGVPLCMIGADHCARRVLRGLGIEEPPVQ